MSAIERRKEEDIQHFEREILVDLAAETVADDIQGPKNVKG